VLIDGEPVRSCTLRVGEASGRRIVTAEGLGTPDKPHPVQAAFIAEQAAQCGYCTNGMVMGSVALLQRVPKPSREEAQKALAGNLCRCGSHDRVLRAVERAAGVRRT
jgi:nicotinate dehydrogenase subunit A